jgi:cation diffusion facilitator CzcD-associated flavoprotein CzcO
VLHDVDIVIVGSGFSGIGMAIRLRQMGVEDFVVLERAADLGGTWRDNSYPGAACDVPSNLYSYSFAPNPGWSRAFSPQGEIQAYLRDCVERFGIAPFLRFDHDVTEAAFDEGAGRWEVTTPQGRYRSRLLVWASGPLSEPRVPDFPGLDSFAGTVFHSAAWNHGYDLSGKRVAVVGTGASAIQFVPQIQPTVAHLDLYQRTPPWILPRRDRAVTRRARWLYRTVPATQRAVRLGVYLRFELLVSVLRGKNAKRRDLIKRYARSFLHSQVVDDELREKLKPHFELGCKRILISDDYYASLVHDNVDVITHAVTRFEPHAVVDTEGTVRPVDAVILATGFQAAEPTFATRIAGVGGRRLSEVWAEGVEAYLGASVAGFPNLFLLIGPNTTLAHNSMIYMIESAVDYAADAVRFLARPGVGTVDVRRDVARSYNDTLQRQFEGSVWVSGSCTSWYLDHRGRNTTLWPDHTYRFRRLTRRFHPGDYVVRGDGRTDPVPAPGRLRPPDPLVTAAR